MSRTKICIVGSGNVAYHLTDLLTKAEMEVSVYSRNEIEARKFTNRFRCGFISDLQEIDASYLVLLCVRDAAIVSCLKQIPEEIAVAYTSGTVSLQSLPERPQLGVFYPLQSFSKEVELQHLRFPILLESKNSQFLSELKILAQNLTGNWVEADSTERLNIHISAVFANNFTNYLWYLSQEHLKSTVLDWKLLLPLVQESLSKLEIKTAYEAQTGPARRQDMETISIHQEHLSGLPKEIYQLLTKGILDAYKNEKNGKL